MPHLPLTFQGTRLFLGVGGMSRRASWLRSRRGVQSSLSDRVSYCSDSRDCHTRCWPPAGGACGCCCWLWIEGEAMEVGGVLLSMRMVSGLHGNCMGPWSRNEHKKKSIFVFLEGNGKQQLTCGWRSVIPAPLLLGWSVIITFRVDRRHWGGTLPSRIRLSQVRRLGFSAVCFALLLLPCRFQQLDMLTVFLKC